MLTENEKKMRKVHLMLTGLVVAAVGIPVATGIAKGVARSHGVETGGLVAAGEIATLVEGGIAGVVLGSALYSNGMGPSGSGPKKGAWIPYAAGGALAVGAFARGIEYAAEAITYAVMR
jgi:hypothetical protein